MCVGGKGGGLKETKLEQTSPEMPELHFRSFRIFNFPRVLPNPTAFSPQEKKIRRLTTPLNVLSIFGPIVVYFVGV